MATYRTLMNWGLATLALLVIALFAATRALEPAAAPMSTPEAIGGVVVTTPDGVALPPPTPVPTTQPTTTSVPTPEETPVAATPVATAVATVAPIPSVTVVVQAPSAPPSAPPGAPPSAPTAGAADPAEAVLSFYEHAAGANFDAAYALWGDRMRAAYPRSPNLDSRFDETAAITFSQLSVAERSGESATVQANFTETYESGASREFIGYWRLILVEGRWLLDEPHY